MVATWNEERLGRPFRHAWSTATMAKDTWRIVTRGPDGQLIIHDFESPDAILRTHLQVGTDDCSTDLALRGAPIFRSLVGPMPEGRNIIRYESPEVFESLTKEWATPKPPRKRVRKPAAGRQAVGDATTPTEAVDGSAG
jgi:hypothetical protein